eukprot:TRINITY_DN29153_c0_g1_i2.p1 TRINITY_DN29153_c0_g1~~TRINITY_DN29153_c0_g1_i2.p1  ORF type:complete len:185 (+),score=-4.11 TRINITY_DN29153_c0_g1_i2:74-556(+)
MCLISQVTSQQSKSKFPLVCWARGYYKQFKYGSLTQIHSYLRRSKNCKSYKCVRKSLRTVSVQQQESIQVKNRQHTDSTGNSTDKVKLRNRKIIRCWELEKLLSVLQEEGQYMLPQNISAAALAISRIIQRENKTLLASKQDVIDKIYNSICILILNGYI